MVKDRAVRGGGVLLQVIGKERRRWLRLKERADAQLTALDHAETAFTSALGREPVPERAMQDTPQQG